MFKRIKREIEFIGDNIPVIGLGAFICCIGGILLWVSGDSSWFYIKTMHSSHSLSLGCIFIIWLIIYALCGIVLSLACLSDRVCQPHNMIGMKSAFLGGFGYLMMLVWYALIFCTRLAFLAGILLILSFIAFGIILVVMKRTFLLLTAAIIIIEVVQIYFICFSFTFYLLK